jgi:hypothetical protein
MCSGDMGARLKQRSTIQTAVLKFEFLTAVKMSTSVCWAAPPWEWDTDVSDKQMNTNKVQNDDARGMEDGSSPTSYRCIGFSVRVRCCEFPPI